jgi:transcriptional regulator with XRE-family HTH domain
VADLRVAFGRRVRELRDKRRLSQEAVAERAGLHWTYVSEVERGRRGPSLDVIGRLALGLGVTVAELFAPLESDYKPRHRKRGVQ